MLRRKAVCRILLIRLAPSRPRGPLQIVRVRLWTAFYRSVEKNPKNESSIKEMKTVYLDCFSGISGDMLLGACVSLGVDPKWVESRIKESGLPTGFTIEATTVYKSKIQGVSVSVVTQMEQSSRNYGKIKEIIEGSLLPEVVKLKSLEVFSRLARAESKVHGCREQDVHFHELGGIDAIVDIVGSILSLDRLGIRKIYSSALPLGKGFADSDHGVIPIPAPATMELLSGIPVIFTDIPFELVTPTGAALVTSLASCFGPPPPMKVLETGYGAGDRDIPGRPNLLRIVCGHVDVTSKDSVIVVETSIDDMNPEIYGFLWDRLFLAGALDCILLPGTMKKGRPGILLQVLVRADALDHVAETILQHTTAAGLRYYHAERRILERRQVQVSTPLGKVEVKLITRPDGTIRAAPEYESCLRLALDSNASVMDIYAMAAAVAEHELAEKNKSLTAGRTDNRNGQ